MWLIYRWQRVRRFIGGRWGHHTGLLFGDKWVRLSDESLEWDEDWNAPLLCRNCYIPRCGNMFGMCTCSCHGPQASVKERV